MYTPLHVRHVKSEHLEAVSGVIIVVLIALGLWYTSEEFLFMTSGVQVRGVVVEQNTLMRMTRSRWGRQQVPDQKVELVYQFKDRNGQVREGRVKAFPEHVPLLVGKDAGIDLIYLKADPDHNTPVKMRHTSYAIGFCVFLAGVGLLFLFYWVKIRPGLRRLAELDAEVPPARPVRRFSAPGDVDRA